MSLPALRGSNVGRWRSDGEGSCGSVQEQGNRAMFGRIYELWFCLLLIVKSGIATGLDLTGIIESEIM